MNPAGEFTIRLAVPDDIEAVLALDRVTDNLPHWALADYRAAIVGAASQPLRCLFVAESDGWIVGLAAGVVHSIAGECWAELETVGVAAGMQRRGLGRELCKAVLDWCRLRGAAHIDLEVRSRSAGPIMLYRQLGFEVVGTRPSYYREPTDDAVLMRLDLQRESAKPVLTAEPTP